MKKISVIFDKRIAKGMLSTFASAISASAVSRGTSFLKDKINQNIFSKRINANFDKINNNLISAFAQGNVKIETKSETITCNSAKYNNKTNLISLEGNVIIKRNKSILTGEKGYMNLNTRKSKIESSKSKRVKGVFSPIQK